jgi:hypothetical protein
MPTAFTHADAFPVIARLITSIHQRTQNFVTHDELVAAILDDAIGRTLVESARNADSDKKAAEWWAGNMVAWFGQRITEEKSEYASQFERTGTKPYAYRPKT